MYHFKHIGVDFKDALYSNCKISCHEFILEIVIKLNVFKEVMSL